MVSRRISILISALLLVLILIPGSQGASSSEVYTFETTNVSGNTILSMSVPNVIYQDISIVFEIMEIDRNVTSRDFTMTNGELGYLDEYDMERSAKHPDAYYRWDGQENGDLLDTDNSYRETVGFIIYGEYLDKDFEMILKLQIKNGSQVLYTETHSFWVIGEPIVIEGYDPNRDIDLFIMYTTVFVISLAIWIVIIFFAIFIRKIMKGERK